jgi:hypothetical protein
MPTAVPINAQAVEKRVELSCIGEKPVPQTIRLAALTETTGPSREFKLFNFVKRFERLKRFERFELISELRIYAKDCHLPGC